MSHDSGNSRASSIFSSHTVGGTSLSTTYNAGIKARHLKLLHPFFIAVDTPYPTVLTYARLGIELLQWAAMLLVPTFFAIDAPWGNLAWGPVMSAIAIPIHYTILPLWEGNNSYGRINDYKMYSIISWCAIGTVLAVLCAMLCKILLASREFSRSGVMDFCVHLLHFITSVAFQPLVHCFLALMVCDNSAATRVQYGNSRGVLSSFRRLDFTIGSSSSDGSSSSGVSTTTSTAGTTSISMPLVAEGIIESNVVGCLAEPYPIVLFTFSLIAVAIIVFFRFILQLFVVDSVPKSHYLFARSHGVYETVMLGANVLLMVLYHYLLMGTGHRLLFTALFAAITFVLSGLSAFFMPFFTQRVNQIFCGFFLLMSFWAFQQTMTLLDPVISSAVKGAANAVFEQISSSTSSAFSQTATLKRGSTTNAYYYIFYNYDAVVALVGGLFAFVIGYAGLANLRISRDWQQCIALAKDGVPPMPTDMAPIFVFPSYLPNYEMHQYRGLEKRILAEERFRRTKEAQLAMQKERVTRSAAGSSGFGGISGDTVNGNGSSRRTAGGADVGIGASGRGTGDTHNASARHLSARLKKVNSTMTADSAGLSRRQLESQLAWTGETSRINTQRLNADQTKAEELWIAYPFLSAVLVVTDVEVAARGLTYFLQSTGLWPPIVMIAFTVRIYTKGLAKFVWSRWIELQFVTFLSAFVPSMNPTALGIVEVLMKKDLSYVEAFEAQRRLGQIGQSLLIRDNVTRRAFVTAQKLHKDALQNMKLFWSRLLMDHVDIVRLGVLAKVITDKRAEGLQQYLRVQTNTSDQQSMLRFAQFLEQVMIDHSSAQTCRELLIENLEQERIANGGQPIEVGGGGDSGEGQNENINTAVSNIIKSKRNGGGNSTGSAGGDKSKNGRASGGSLDDDDSALNGGRTQKDKSKTIASLSFKINTIFAILAALVIALFACGFVMHSDRHRTINRLEYSGTARYLSQEVAALVARLADPLTEATQMPQIRTTLQRRLSTLRDSIAELSFGDLRSSDDEVQSLYAKPLGSLRFVATGEGSSASSASSSSSSSAASTSSSATGFSVHLAGGMLQTTNAFVATVEQFLRSIDMVAAADGGSGWTVSDVDNGQDSTKTSMQDLDTSAALAMLIASLASEGVVDSAAASAASSSSTTSGNSGTAATTNNVVDSIASLASLSASSSTASQQVSASRNKAIAAEIKSMASAFSRTNAWLSVATAFNYSVTVYVDEGNTILRRTQYITTALFIAALLVIVAVNFVVVFNLRKINTTKISTLGLFTLIPRNALERLRDEVSDWLERFDEPDAAFQRMKADKGLEDDEDVRRRMIEDDPTFAAPTAGGAADQLMVGAATAATHHHSAGAPVYDPATGEYYYPNHQQQQQMMLSSVRSNATNRSSGISSSHHMGGGGHGVPPPLLTSPTMFASAGTPFLPHHEHSSPNFGGPALASPPNTSAAAAVGGGENDEGVDELTDNKLFNRLLLRGDLSLADTGGHHHNHPHGSAHEAGGAAAASLSALDGTISSANGSSRSGGVGRGGMVPSSISSFPPDYQQQQQLMQYQHQYQQQQGMMMGGGGWSSGQRGGGGYGSPLLRGKPLFMAAGMSNSVTLSNSNSDGRLNSNSTNTGMMMMNGINNSKMTYYNGYGYNEDAIIDADLRAIEESTAQHNNTNMNMNGGRNNSGGGGGSSASSPSYRNRRNSTSFGSDPRKGSGDSSNRNSSLGGGSSRANSNGNEFYYGNGGVDGIDYDDADVIAEMQQMMSSSATSGGQSLSGRVNNRMEEMMMRSGRRSSSRGGGGRNNSGDYTTYSASSSPSSRPRRGAMAVVAAIFGGGNDNDNGNASSSSGGGSDIDANTMVFRYVSQSTCDLIITLLSILALLICVALVTLYSITLMGVDANMKEIMLCEETLEKAVQMIDARREVHRVTERFVMRVAVEDSKDVNTMQEARRYDLAAAELRLGLQSVQSNSWSTKVNGATSASQQTNNNNNGLSSSGSSYSSSAALASSYFTASAAAFGSHVSGLIDTHEDLWARIQVIQNSARVLACSTNAALDCEHFPLVSWDRRQFIDEMAVDESVTAVNTYLNQKPITGTVTASLTLPRAPDFITVENYKTWLPRNETFDMKLSTNRRLATARAALASPAYFQWYEASLQPLFDVIAVISTRGNNALVQGSEAMARLVQACIGLSSAVGLVALVMFALLRFSAGTFRFTRHALSLVVLLSIACIVLSSVGLTYFPVIDREGSVMLNVISLWNESIAANDDLLSHARRAALFKDQESLAIFGRRMMDRQYDTLWGEFAATMSEEVLPEVQTCVLDSRNAFFVEAIAVTLAANLFNVTRVPPVLKSFVWNASADVNAVRFVLENPTQKMFSDRPSDMARNSTDKRALVRELLLGPIRRTSFERSNTACKQSVIATRTEKSDAVKDSHAILSAFLITCISLNAAMILLVIVFAADIIRFKYEAISAGVVKTRDERVTGGAHDDALFVLMTRRSRIALLALAILFTTLFLFNILEIESALPKIQNQNLASLREFEMYRSLALSATNNENRSTYRTMAEASGAATMDVSQRFYRGSETLLPTAARTVVGTDGEMDTKLFGGILGFPASFECASTSNSIDDSTDMAASATSATTGVTYSVLSSWSSSVPALLSSGGVDMSQRRWRDEVVALSRSRHTPAATQMLNGLHAAADSLGPALHETTRMYSDHARTNAHGGLVGYMVIWALIVVALFYEFLFVFRPIVEQLTREEEGTKVMLKMIPLDVRERVPAIAEYLETGVVLRDIKVHEINEAAIDLSTVPTVSIDFDGTILTFSKAAEQCFYWTREEVIGKNIRILMPDDIASEHDSYLAAYRRTGVKHIIGNVLKTRAMRRNGALFPAELSVKEIHRGRSTTFIGTIRDVGQETELEKAMAVSSAISDAAAIPIVVIDKKGVILRFNHAARQTFRTEGSMIGRRVNELMPPHIAQLHDGFITKYMLHRIKNVIDRSRVMQAVRVSTGELFPVRITVKELKGAEGGAVVGTSRDVQFIGYIEDLTRHVGLRLSTLISDAIPITSPIPYVETNSDGVILTFSPAAEQLFGYTAQEVRGKNINILMPPDVAERHSGFIRTYHETGRKRMLDATTLLYAQKRLEDGKRFATFPARISVRELSAIAVSSNATGVTTMVGGQQPGGSPTNGGGGGTDAMASSQNFLVQQQQQFAASLNTAAGLHMSGSNNNPSASGGASSNTSGGGIGIGGATGGAVVGDPTGMGGILSGFTTQQGTTNSRFVAFIEDISDDRQLEKENVVTARLTAISPIPMLITDAYGTILNFPQSAEKAFGYSAAEAIGMDATKLLGPTDYQFVPEAFTQMEGGGSNGKGLGMGGFSTSSGGAANGGINSRLLMSQTTRRVLIKPKGGGKSFYTELLIKPVMGATYYTPPPPPPVQLTQQQQNSYQGNRFVGIGGGGDLQTSSGGSASAAGGAFMQALLGIDPTRLMAEQQQLGGSHNSPMNVGNRNFNNSVTAALMRQYQVQVQQHIQTQKYRQFQQIRLVAIFRSAFTDQLDNPTEGIGTYTESISRLATTPLVWIDSRGTILGCSDSTIERFQWARDELIGQNVSLLMPDTIASKHDEYLFNYRQRLALKGKEVAAKTSAVIGKDRKVMAKTRDEQVFAASLLVKDIHIGSLEPVFVGYIRDLTSEMELATQKHLSAAIIQTSFIPIICIDQNGLVQEFSSAAEGVFGYARHEIIGENVKMLMPEHVAKSHDGYLKAYAKTRIKAIIDSKRPVTALRRDRSEFQAELMVKEITHKDSFGKDTTEYIGYVRDLSHQTILDQATRINELVASLSAVPILIINPRGTIIECNAATEKDFGYQSGELVGRNVKVLMPDEVAIEHDAYLSRYRATRLKRVIDNTRVVRALRKDRSTFSAELSVREVRKVDGTEGQFIGYIRDVTVEQQIAATNYINTTMMDLSPVPVLVVDHLGRVQHFSRAAAHTFEYPVKDVIGKNVKMLMPEEIAKNHDMYLRNYLETHKPHVIGSTRRVTAKKSNGKLFPVELNIREVFDDHLKVPVYVGFVHDLSEQAEIEALSAFSEMVNVLSPVPVISIDHEGTVIRFSASAEQEFKVSASEIIGKNVKLLQPPEVADHHDMYLRRYSETGIKHVIDNTRATVAKRWDNTTFRVSLFVKEVVDSGHEFPLFVGYIKNIEEDNRIEEASKENAAMQLLAPLPVFVITRNGIVLDVNPAVEAVFGYHQSEVKGQNINIIMPAHIAAHHDEYLQRYQVTRVKNVIDQIRSTQGKRKDGTIIPIEISIREVQVPGMETQYVGYVRDTSMSQRMVESLRWNEAIISLAATPLVVIDPDGIIMKFTLEAEKLFMYNADEVIGKNVKVLMPYDIAKKHDRYISQYHVTRVKRVIDHNRRVKGRKKNGDVFLCELGVREILNEDDTMTEAFAGYIRPISTDQSSMIEGSAEINGMMHAVSLHGVIIIDEAGIIEKANPAVADMFGVQEATLIGKNVKMLMPYEIAKNHDMYLANYLVSGVKRVIDTKRVTYGKNVATQVIFPMELSVKELSDSKIDRQRDGGGEFGGADGGGGGEEHVPRRYLGCIRYIEHEIQIERQRTLNKHTLDLSMSGTIVSNHQGGIIMFSHVAEKLFGCTSDQVVGKVNISDLMPHIAQQLDGTDFLAAYRRAVTSSSNQQHLLNKNQPFSHQMNALLNQQQQQQQNPNNLMNNTMLLQQNSNANNGNLLMLNSQGSGGAIGGLNQQYFNSGGGDPNNSNANGNQNSAMMGGLPYYTPNSAAAASATPNRGNNAMGTTAPGGGGASDPTTSYISRTVAARRVDNGTELMVNIFIRELYFKTVPGAEPHFVTYVDPSLVGDTEPTRSQTTNNNNRSSNTTLGTATQAGHQSQQGRGR